MEPLDHFIDCLQVGIDMARVNPQKDFAHLRTTSRLSVGTVVKRAGDQINSKCEKLDRFLELGNFLAALAL